MNFLVIVILVALTALSLGAAFLFYRFVLWLFKKRSGAADAVRYYTDKSLLRGHDFVASLWFDCIKNKDPDRGLVAKIVAGATQVEKESGRKYDARPIRQGWMTKQDYEDYFAFVDQYGSLDVRYRILFQQTAYFKIKQTPGFEGATSTSRLHEPAENKGLRELAYEIRKATI